MGITIAMPKNSASAIRNMSITVIGSPVFDYD